MMIHVVMPCAVTCNVIIALTLWWSELPRYDSNWIKRSSFLSWWQPVHSFHFDTPDTSSLGSWNSNAPVCFRPPVQFWVPWIISFPHLVPLLVLEVALYTLVFLDHVKSNHNYMVTTAIKYFTYFSIVFLITPCCYSTRKINLIWLEPLYMELSLHTEAIETTVLESSVWAVLLLYV